jgi:hypothetical protein
VFTAVITDAAACQPKVRMDPVLLRTRGRPTLYTSDACDRVLELASQGCSRAELAAALGICTKTLRAWTRAHPEFREAMRIAKDFEYAWWMAKGRMGQFDKTWNASSWALQMRHRFGARFRDEKERHSLRPTPAASQPVDEEAMRASLERKLARIADAGGAAEVSREPVEIRA